MSATVTSGLSRAAQPAPHALQPKLLKLVKPEYPSRAAALGIEGEVIVRYNIDQHGRVTDVHIVSARPERLFERAVIDAMRYWRYEARAVNDVQKTIWFRIDGSTVIE
ncbi:TonB family protein [Serratia microhaemolytica]|uniref:TonB family protein n=1 Tax=Serratia microhaemolytica TaxID=2675110 RepID=UPI00139239BA|nr:TonB family protein [Serratia microhaemolytica]